MTRPLLLVALSAIACAGCGDVPATANGPGTIESGPAADNRASVAPGDDTQGLSSDERERLFHTSTGSEMVPLSWLKALTNSKSGKPFLENLERYGFIPDPTNPDGLPVGLTVTDAKIFPGIGKMVGANCAACHVGKITRDGKSQIILGAPNILDFNNFVVDLNASVKATAEDPIALAKFLDALAKNGDATVAESTRKMLPALQAVIRSGKQDADDARSKLGSALTSATGNIKVDLGKIKESGSLDEARKSFADRLKGDAKRLADKLDPAAALEATKADLAKLKENLDGGFQDLAFQAGILKSLTDYHQKLSAIHEAMTPEPGPGRIDAFGAIRDAVLSKDDFIAPTAPVSYPHIWLVNQTTWFHWDGNTNSMLQRDVGQTLGLGAIFNPETFYSTVLPQNLAKLEHLIWQIRSPKWPEDTLGMIDRAKADRGEALYVKECIKCHLIATPFDKLKRPPPYPPKDLMVLGKLDEVKTDPGRVKNFAINVGRDPVTKKGGTPFAPALKGIAYKFTQKALEANKIDAKDAAAWDRPESEVRWPVNDGYVGRPLAGIWATAPFLHNGSVPTLDDLLLPGDERPKVFYVGSREFDAKRVGYVSRKDQIPPELIEKNVVWPLDTSLPGNLRTGHEYGTSLSPSDRADLLEYLKTL